MVLKIILIILVIFIAIIIILPFLLNIAGFQIFQSASLGGGGDEILLRSSDNGKNWEKISFPAALLDISFHPANPEIIFAGTKSNGLWKSEDRGKQWKKMNDSLGILKSSSDVYKIAIPRSNPKIIYLAVFQNNRGRVLKSEDNGQSFREIYFVTQDRFAVFDIYVKASDPDEIIIATGQGGILESRDGGKSWHVIKWFREPVVHLEVNPVFSNEIYAVTSSGLLQKTFDRGVNWALLNRGVQEVFARGASRETNINPFNVFTAGRSFIEIFYPDPNIFTTIYIGSRIGLLRSQNGGFIWQSLNLPAPPESLPVKAVAISPFDSALIFAGAGKELYKSDDGGINWSVYTLPAKSNIQKIFIHPKNPEVMFAILGR